MVPEESERITVVIFSSGSDAPELSAAIAGSFHLVMPAVEDLRENLCVENELVDAVEVVCNCDRAEDEGRGSRLRRRRNAPWPCRPARP